MITISSATEHERRERVLAAAGVSSTTWTRVETYSNEVWLGDDIVVRINASEKRRLVREARIAALVPPAAKYPALIASGHADGVEWTITRRVPGISLGHAWPHITPTQRERAVHELAAMLAALHASPTECIESDLGPDIIGRAIGLGPHVISRDIVAYDGGAPHTLPLNVAHELVDELRAQLGGTEPTDARALLDAAKQAMSERWPAFEQAPLGVMDPPVARADLGLVHGDPHFENFVWDGEHVSAMLDLEWSRMSWLHGDVEILLAVAESPAEFASPDREHEVDPAHYADIPRWLSEAQPGWFAHPRLLDRLECLHVSRALGLVEDAFEHPMAWARLRAAVE